MTRYTITIPTHTNDGEPIPAWQVLAIEADLLAIGGGFTKTTAMGAWRAPNGTKYYERVSVFTIDGEGLAIDIEAAAVEIARELKQEAVYVTRSEITATLVTA